VLLNWFYIMMYMNKLIITFAIVCYLWKLSSLSFSHKLIFLTDKKHCCKYWCFHVWCSVLSSLAVLSTTTLNKIGERIISCFSLQLVLNISSFVLTQFVLSLCFTFSIRYFGIFNWLKLDQICFSFYVGICYFTIYKFNYCTIIVHL
jgi:hypothetical protein